MKTTSLKTVILILSAVGLSGICSLAYSQKKQDAAPAAGATKITYVYQQGKQYKYQSDTKIVQDLDINGQSMQVNVTMNLACEVKGSGKQGENLGIAVKIDSMAALIDSPQGSNGGPVQEVKDKSFNIVITPSGKAVDLSGAAKIEYNSGNGQSNLSQQFIDFFPALPAGPVKPGDTWTVNDTINTKSAGDTLYMPQKTDYKFEGTEVVDGVECAKITAALSGTRKMVTQSGGMEIHINGPFTGTMELLIGVKDGCLVKETVATKMTGTMELPDQGGISFPDVMTVNATNKLVK